MSEIGPATRDSSPDGASEQPLPGTSRAQASRTPGHHRRTRQRAAVAAVLAARPEFRTAQEIHDLLGAGGASVGLATVYRTLQAMAEAGEVDVIRTPDGQLAYRACGRSSAHHHHLVCRGCGRSVDVGLDDFEDALGALGAHHGFRDVLHEVTLFGLCPDC